MTPAPYADDLKPGVPLQRAPSVTVDEGLCASYQAIVGDPLSLTLSDPLSTAVTGSTTRLVNPCLALSVAIGQSTVATRRVIANLLYRDVDIHRQVHVGDTLTTTVTPLAAALTSRGRDAGRAKVLLGIRTTTESEVILDFSRVALLPLRDADTFVEFGEVPTASKSKTLEHFGTFAHHDWDLSHLPDSTLPAAGATLTDALPDTVTSAVELVRLTQNQARVHRDARATDSGRRLVYGGHTIGLAQAALDRTVPGVATYLGWRGCDHLAPVFEDDLLTTSLTLIDRARTDAGELAGFDVTVDAERPDGTTDTVLRWTPVALCKATTEGDPR